MRKTNPLATLKTNQVLQNMLLLKAGDSTAFRLIYDMFVSPLHAYVMQFVKSQTLADDIVQEVFIKIWEKREHLDETKSLQAFIYKIAKNQVINLLTHRSVEEKVRKEIILGATQASNATEEMVHFQETTTIIQQGIAQLPTQQRRIFELCKTQGLTYEQAAKETGLSISTINVQMVNSLRFLKNHLQSKGKIALTLVALLSN